MHESINSNSTARRSHALVFSLVGAVPVSGSRFFSADKLDAATRTAKGGDTAEEIRSLETGLKRLRDEFQQAKSLAIGSEEAAAKCQVGLYCNKTV